MRMISKRQAINKLAMIGKMAIREAKTRITEYCDYYSEDDLLFEIQSEYINGIWRSYIIRYVDPEDGRWYHWRQFIGNESDVIPKLKEAMMYLELN